MWGAIAASTLLLGMFAAFVWRPATRTLGKILAFGAGALFCAVAFELADEALASGGDRLLAVGTLLGAGVFVTGSWLLRSKTDSGLPDADEDSRSIILGAALDGIPESLALGASVAAATGSGPAVSITLLVAIALSNFPEAIGATAGMLDSGHHRWKIMLVWGSLVAASSLAAGIGYAVLADASEVLGARLDAFTAGAILAMLTDTMIPDAYRDGGRIAGMFSVLGFGLSVLVG
jgi:ZIP family zinc transporter